MIRLTANDDGVLLPVKATAGARANGIRGEHDGRLRVQVTQVAERGKANKAIVAVLAKQLKIPKSAFELVSGQTHSEKTFRVQGVSLNELQAKLEAILSEHRK